MNNNLLKTLLGLLIIFLAFSAYGQEISKRDYQRWIVKKPVIKDIQVTIEEGKNSHFSEGKIKRTLFSRKRSGFGGLLRAIKKDRSSRVQRETLSRDTLAVKFLYISNGFLGVQVKETFEPLYGLQKDDNEPARIKIEITEGNRFKYADVKIEGEYPDKFSDKFNGIRKSFKSGKIVNPFDLRQATFEVKTILANNGYPYAISDYLIDTTVGENQADITLFINSDSLVHFGDVEIQGTDKYAESAIRREFTFKKGDLYRRKDFMKSQKRLLGTGYFLTMRLESAVNDSSSEYERVNPDFNLHLKERKPHYVSIKTGAAQDTIPDLIWHFGVSWGKRNFLGSRQLELSASSKFKIIDDFTLKEHNYQARITEPWLFGIKMPITFIGKFEPGVQSLVQYYSKQTWSISAITIKNFGENLKITGGLQYEQLVIYNIDTSQYANADSVIVNKGLSVRRKLYVSLLRDNRNSIFIPSTGSVVSLKFEYIGGFLGGGESFYVAEGSWSRYQQVWRGLIYASRVRAGLVKEFGDATSVPVDDRFYIGGANTIRGYSEKELGVDESTGEGSNIIFMTNHELRFPLISKLWMSIFADMGNGFKYEDRSKLKKIENLVITGGIGIQFISPAGPIRLDYAQQIQKANTDTKKDFRWHFTILYAF